ncbi:Nucleotide-binding universal stress protein, UspA family [Halogranum amylolyticum]|uniref:Nucleotide-binding universal stress protein, UspA family n=1 Tax=Halogranum amylolyticum TaxID=660520 RepID=A0A1H8WSV8_9EURY|nr:universal stress protein [Halogranum amylolyticum]SEP30760.1 Nucleotide-binding universal stress protein, UspA family [Halogranum amylolyticum]
MGTEYERILIPTDGSPEAEAAVAHAVELAARYDATLHALSVADVSHFHGLDADTSVIVEGFDEEARTAVDHVADAGAAAGVTVETAVEHGPASETILTFVDDHDVDLVVVGTRGRHGLEQFLLGSVADRLVRRAAVPVLTIPSAD